MAQYLAPSFDAYHAATILAQALSDLKLNPAAVKKASDEMLATKSLSDERKAEAARAEKSISEAADISKAADAKKKEADEYVKNKLEEVSFAQKNMEEAAVELNEQRRKHKLNVDAHNTSVSEFDRHQKIMDDALDARHKLNAAAEAIISSKEEEFKKREAAVSAGEEKIKSELQKISAKRKKLLDAAKED